MRWRPAGLAWGLWALAIVCLSPVVWLQYLLGQVGRPDLTVLDVPTIAVAAAHVGLATVGAVVASRQPRHPVGWLLLTFGVLGNASFVIAGYANDGCWLAPGRCRPPDWSPRTSPPTPPPGSRAWGSSYC
jgi:hypothetical protein